MTKREKGAERRERLEAERAAQKSAQRKRNLVTAGIGVGIGAVIIGGTAFGIYSSEKSKPSNQPFSAFGVSQSAAQCNDVVKTKVTGSGEHVGPGTDKSDISVVKYDTVPPTSGQHFPNWLEPSRHFYSVADMPRVENTVHNLEHGYNVVWYASNLDQSKVDELKGIADKVSRDPKTDKFIVRPWDTNYGSLPEGKTVAISHWGAKEGAYQVCGDVSGEAIAQFVQDHPETDAPEPNAP